MWSWSTHVMSEACRWYGRVVYATTSMGKPRSPRKMINFSGGICDHRMVCSPMKMGRQKPALHCLFQACPFSSSFYCWLYTYIYIHIWVVKWFAKGPEWLYLAFLRMMLGTVDSRSALYAFFWDLSGMTWYIYIYISAFLGGHIRLIHILKHGIIKILFLGLCHVF